MYYMLFFLCSLFIGTITQPEQAAEQKPKTFKEILETLSDELNKAQSETIVWHFKYIDRLPYVYGYYQEAALRDPSLTPEEVSEVENFLKEYKNSRVKDLSGINPQRIELRKSPNDKTYIEFLKNNQKTGFNRIVLFVGSTKKEDLNKAIGELFSKTPYDNQLAKAYNINRFAIKAINDPSYAFTQEKKCKNVLERKPYEISKLSFDQKNNDSQMANPASYCSLVEEIADIHRKNKTPLKRHYNGLLSRSVNFYFEKFRNMS